MIKIFIFLGDKSVSFIKHVGGMFLLFAETVYLVISAPFKEWKNIKEQMVIIGVMSLPVVIVTGAFTGMVLAVQSYYQFHKIRAETLVGVIVALSMVKELGPVLTGIMLTGRVGAAMAAELGTMKVTEQIDALYTLATNPVQYLVVPRFITCLVLLPVLTIYTDVIGILGGYVVGVKMLKINSAFYLDQTVYFTEISDVITGLIKAAVFGMIIATVGCYKGLTTDGGAEGVGKATTGSVVTASIMILVVDFFMVLIFTIFDL
jgi:phospholipid/cholesterol/gamma-HCH transport system permease protein